MTKLVYWLKLLYDWLRRIPIHRYYWWAFWVLVAAAVGIYVGGRTETAFRLTGTLLQLGGVLTVVWGILRTRAEFNQPLPCSLLRRWYDSFPFRKPSPLIVSADATFTADGTADFHVIRTHGPSPDQTFEGRLKHLEGIVKELEEAHGKTDIVVSRVERRVQQTLKAQASHLSGQIDGVSKKIEIAATGGIHVSGVGVILLMFGTVLAGAAPELGNWLPMAPTALSTISITQSSRGMFLVVG